MEGRSGADDFERKWMPRFGQTLPCETDVPRQFFRGHAFGDAGDQSRNLQICRGLHHRVERVHGRHYQSSTCLPSFSAKFDYFTRIAPARNR